MNIMPKKATTVMKIPRSQSIVHVDEFLDLVRRIVLKTLSIIIKNNASIISVGDLVLNDGDLRFLYM